MQREINFRGRRIDNGEWVYGYLYKSKTSSWITDSININLETHRNFAWFKVDHNTVGQFTGLRDRKGKEIYEGDIVKLKPKENISIKDEKTMCGIKEVVWNDKDACFYYEYFVTMSWGGFDSVEIIGNIYEAPELLK